ncbi:uncharacterized protein LOC142584380 [Dermacentor variabilis]|uniref:uncharacterized protein LOC142584380 n=1 Tax=Dermacentor variabilis TaxID=34621 RepID=UPI003F5AFC8E
MAYSGTEGDGRCLRRQRYSTAPQCRRTEHDPRAPVENAPTSRTLLLAAPLTQQRSVDYATATNIGAPRTTLLLLRRPASTSALAVLMENLLLWFILLIVIAACGIFGLWLLCNVRSYLGNNGGSSNQMTHPLFADEQQQPQSPCMDPRQQHHHHWRPEEPPQPYPQPMPQPQPKQQPQPLPPLHDQQQQQRNGYPFHPYYIEPPIDYTPPPTVEPPRKHTVHTQTYQTYAKKKTVKIEDQRSSSSPN